MIQDLRVELESPNDKKAIETAKPSGIRRPTPEGEPKKDEHPTELQIMLEKFSRQRIADGVDFDDDNDSPIMASHHLSSMTAGDGNPVRHSLISLVMEEDVPMLMEAMAEKLNFVFEDLLSTPSSSNEGIIRNKAKREERRKMRNASKIDFVSSPPAVFTYPDEMTAVEHAEWHPGEHITFDQYQKICEIERERYEQQKRELSKWHASLIAGRNINPDDVVSAHPASPTANDYQLGVTSRISYNTPPIFSNSAEFKSTTMSLIAGK
uniref:PEHE domain-containing protein n=1 Tax=Ascaris lumbricoides TaxID=6252 RepID=A0A0M3IKW5_ASCLU